MTGSVRSLGSVLRLRNEIVHPRDHPTGTTTFVGLEHIEPHSGRRIGELEIKLDELTGRKSRFYPGDIVYGYLRPYLNKVWLADLYGYCSVDQYVFEVDSRVADARYVALFMRSDAYLSAAPIDATPGQLPRIRTDEVLSVKFPVPSMTEQRRIAAMLDSQLEALHGLSDASVAKVAPLAALRKTLTSAPFQLESATENGDRTIASIARIQSGYAFRSEWFRERGARLLRNANVGHRRIDWSESAYLDPAMEASFEPFQLSEGDIVLSLDRPVVSTGLKVARVSARDVPSLLLQRVARLVPFPDVNPDYLFAFLLSPQFEEAVSGHDQSLGVPHVSPRQVGAIRLPVPAIDQQRRIASALQGQLAAIDAIEIAMQAERVAIDLMSGALLRRAFGDIAA